VETGKLDATLTDLPAAVFYRDRFAGLAEIGAPVGGGYYVILLRKGDTALRDALNAAIETLVADGKLEAIYRRYGLWNDAQLKLAELGASAQELGIRAERQSGWAVIKSRGWLLVEAAGVTVLLACVSMPLAMLLGLAVALVRLFGPLPLRWLAIGYIELLRGTPLLLQGRGEDARATWCFGVNPPCLKGRRCLGNGMPEGSFSSARS
jgi:polar amino acid transport system substrate-binding protein